MIVVVVGAGINGLVAAHYLRRAGHTVTVLDRADRAGGACVSATATVDGVTQSYALGASVLGLMPDFIFRQTGLADRLDTYVPSSAKRVYFPTAGASAWIYRDPVRLDQEFKERWGETGDAAGFRADEARVVALLQQGFRAAVPPDLEHARAALGDELTRLWITGSAADLLAHYFTAERTKIYMAMTVTESGPVSLGEPSSAFTLPLMDSGSVFGGYYGFVKPGLWRLTEELAAIDREIGVEFKLGARVERVDPERGTVRYRHDGVDRVSSFDHLVFATDPTAAAHLVGDEETVHRIAKQRVLGSSGKITLFFRQPVRWKDGPDADRDAAFRFIFSTETLADFERGTVRVRAGDVDYEPGYIQVYCEGAAMRRLGLAEPYDRLTLFFKNLGLGRTGDELDDVKTWVTAQVLAHVANPEDCVWSRLLTPKDLQELFLFPGGNLDHTELTGGQQFADRQFAADPAQEFYRFGGWSNLTYCGAGSYPCGSIAGTPGYMAATQLNRRLAAPMTRSPGNIDSAQSQPGRSEARLSLSKASAVAERLYHVRAMAFDLPSERDQNVLLESESGERFVLKLANPAERREVLEAECAVMLHLEPTGLTPRLIRTVDDSAIGMHGPQLVRLISVLPGTTLGTVRLHTDALRRDLGRAVGRLGRALASFDHPAFHRDFHWDLANAERVIGTYLPLIADPALAQRIAAFAAYHRAHVVPMLPDFRRGVIHGDANDYNVLIDEARQSVTGILDFGDMVYSHIVNDVAIAMAYVALSADDPLAAAAAVVSGHHEMYPLTEPELEALFSLMCMRLCMSACVAAKQTAERPGDDYLRISQGPLARTLPILAAIHPRFAHYTFRDACGLPPVPHAPRVTAWLAEQSAGFAPLIGRDLRTTPVAPIDLSAGSPLVSSEPSENTPAELDRRIQRRLAERGATVGAGGYDEARLIYAWPDEPTGTEPRTIHMGLDLSLAPGSPLHAPLDGVVHGFENAAAHHDYGPIIVLRHRTEGPDSVEFYSLYGHLSCDSLEGLRVGQPIAKGAVFARVGSAPSNGDWWTHVHVQLVTDLLDVSCNVDGVVRASQRRVWKSLCPDPNLILGIRTEELPHQVSKSAIAAARRAHVGGNVRVSYGANPLNIVRGYKQYLYDEAAHRFLDAYNNVAHVGHGHPRVVRAVSDQLAVLNTNTRYLQEQLTRYAEQLTALLPASLSVCYFTASGSEANELALRLARARTGARDVIVMDSAYHGHTTTLIDISPYKHAGPGGEGAPDWVHRSPLPDVYRARGAHADPGSWFAARVGEVIADLAAKGRRLSAYIAETCPSVGGQIMLPKGFLADVYARVRAAGGICIADEVQTGFGRLGTHFWAFEAHDVTPDIVVLGKPIANGYPMGAVITTRAIADSFDNGMEFFSTFGGSTAACVAGRMTLQVTLDEELQRNALLVGERLLSGLRPLMGEFELVGDVRGSGLFLGVELVRDRHTLEPAPDEATFVVDRMRLRGVLAGTDGPYHNVVKIRGPMPLSLADADQVVDTLARALRELPGRR